MKAIDINGKEIKKGQIVKIIHDDNDHNWLKKGNTLRVRYWENRSFCKKNPFVVVFLESKKGGKLCSSGVLDRKLEVLGSDFC